MEQKTATDLNIFLTKKIVEKKESASKIDINLTSNLINRRIDVFFWVYFTTEFIRN